MSDSEPPRSDGAERAVLLFVAARSAAVAITCGSEGGFAGKVRAPEPAPVVAPAPLRADLAAPSSAPPSDPDPAGVPAPAAPGGARDDAHLARFFGALSELERKQRRTPVRILWLGDSHTSADFWTGVVRRALWQRFGAGGPGFLRAGVPAYRHDQAKIGREGRFHVHPDPPARRAPQGDGVFGLGGMRAVPESGARVTYQLAPGAVSGDARFEIWFRLPPGASLRVDHGKRALPITARGPHETVEGSPIQRVKLSAGAGDALMVTATGGAPELFGVVAEGTEPGVVLDTAGIDGARLATPLAWAEAPFVAEVRARDPSLFVLAYGTNEVFDALRVDRYAGQLAELVGRLRRGAPSADCLVVGPPDAAARGGGSEPRVAELDRVERDAAIELGCAYLSAYALMGGEGSFERFMNETPRLARPDRIHLTPKGYERLGEATARELLSRYEAFKSGRKKPRAATRP